MLDVQLSIQIEESFASAVATEWLRQVVELTLIAAGISSPVELGLVIASDNTVHELNRIYRGIDDTTDVLAFALSEPSSDEAKHFAMPPDEILHLGEIIISHPQAEKQAKEQQHPLDQELALLVAHGVLHLLGYDHEHPEGEKEMRAMETKVLDAINDK